MNLKNTVLLTASCGIGGIGLAYLIAPQFMYGLYGVGIESVNASNMVRGAYGGLFVAFSGLFALGVVRPGLANPALVGLLTFMSGFALGRLVSIVVDGLPSLLVLGLLALELCYSLLAAALLSGAMQEKSPGTPVGSGERTGS